MPRKARLVIPGYPHHVTQRGNRRQQIFFDASDYQAYLDLLVEFKGKAGVDIWAYCLMPNHVHMIAVPHRESSLADCFGVEKKGDRHPFPLLQ
jgi:putative transposase